MQTVTTLSAHSCWQDICSHYSTTSTNLCWPYPCLSTTGKVYWIAYTSAYLRAAGGTSPKENGVDGFEVHFAFGHDGDFLFVRLVILE